MTAKQLEYIIKAEHALGRPLPKGAHVHHANRNKYDNKNSNLVICQDAEYHALLHKRIRAKEAVGDPNAEYCYWCQSHCSDPRSDECRVIRNNRQFKDASKYKGLY